MAIADQKVQEFSERLVTAEEGKPVSWRQGLLRYALAWPSVRVKACALASGIKSALSS